MKLRLAQPNDAEELLEIYAHYLNTPITFECILPTKDEFSQRIADISIFFPYLVCEDQGSILGYAYAHCYRERQAYQWGAELSVYVRQSAQSQGVGKRLYTQLLAVLQLQGIINAYAGVTTPNARSEALHRAMGFQVAGIFHKVGYKAGNWHSVTWFEKQIAPYQPCPQQPISITQIPAEQLAELLASECKKPCRL